MKRQVYEDGMDNGGDFATLRQRLGQISFCASSSMKANVFALGTQCCDNTVSTSVLTVSRAIGAEVVR